MTPLTVFLCPAVPVNTVGTVAVWGRNDTAQQVIPAATAYNIFQVAAGWGHVLALSRNGTLFAWGENGDRQATIPRTVAQNTVLQIAAGAFHSLAVINNNATTSVSNVSAQAFATWDA